MVNVSVIIPLYNKENAISNTVNSVLQQTYSNFELIIINDGSTDRSLEIIESINDSRIHIYTKKNGGVSIIRKTKCFDFWERNVLFPKTKRSFFRTPTLPFSA